MFRIDRTYTFAAAHRIEGHPKCGRLHGHNYVVTVELAGDKLPSDGMLLDYGALDAIVKPVVDAMDHRYLVSISNTAISDPYADIAVMRGDAFLLGTQASTAEHIAKMLHEKILNALWNAKVSITRDYLAITVSESAKSNATYTIM